MRPCVSTTPTTTSAPSFSSGPGLLQHLVGLAHARSGAEEDLQASGAALFLLCLGKQRLWRRALVWLTPLICHEALVLTRAFGPRALLRAGAIQSKIERKHIDARLAENTEGAALDVIRDELADVIFRQVARLRNARHLEIGGFRRDVRVEPAARRGYQVGRNLG